MKAQPEKAFIQALMALKRKDYGSASEYFEMAAPYFRGNKEFRLLRETNRLLLAVKKELKNPGIENRIEIEEMFTNG